MSDAMSPVDLGNEEATTVTVSSPVPASKIDEAELHALPNTKEESKPQDALLTPSTPQSPLNSKTLSSASSSPLKTSFTGHTIDEEKVSDPCISRSRPY
jgi:hypothetical protein